MNYNDNAPVGNTCGKIDDAISFMNEVRSDNEELRKWGNDLHDELQDALKEIEALKSEIDCLEEQVSELKYIKQEG